MQAIYDYVFASMTINATDRHRLLAFIDEAENDRCRVYWGSHGCDLPRGHDGPHVCESCYDPADIEGYVGRPPYYGPETVFYGEDATDAAERMGRAIG